MNHRDMNNSDVYSTLDKSKLELYNTIQMQVNPNLIFKIWEDVRNNLWEIDRVRLEVAQSTQDIMKHKYER